MTDIEDDDYQASMRIDRLSVILRNARRMFARKHAKSPNWVIVMELFGLGSTYAHRLCRDLGFDPAGLSFTRPTTQPGKE